MDHRDSLKDKFISMIVNDLTIGRTDAKLKPFTIYEINDFLLINDSNIEQAVKIMIDDYTKDGTLEHLKNCEFDWIAEYLYDFVDPFNVNRYKEY